MTMTPKIIEAAIFYTPKDGGEADVAKGVAERLAFWQKVADGVRDSQNAAERIKAECEKKLKKNADDAAALRQSCPHPARTYFYGQESADSYATCDVCGEVLR